MNRTILAVAAVALVGLGAFLVPSSEGHAEPPVAQVDTPAAEPQGSCCRYVIAGCDKSAQICVPDSCGSAAERRARSAFESAHSCRSSSTKSYLGTCSNERCDIDLR